MKPVKFEIIGEDKTKPATDSAAQNLDALNVKIEEQKALITKLQGEINKMQSTTGKGAGMHTEADVAQINKLQAEIASLQAQIIELEKLKHTTSTTPIVPPKMEEEVFRAQKSAYGLGMSVQQVARELPALAMGPQMFILAISNNLPILADNIKRVRLENEALAATGQPTVSVFKQLIKAVFSWQTALVVGITVLLLFGKQIGEFVTNLFRSEEAIRSNIKAIDDLTSARAKGAKDAQGELTRLRLLYGGLMNENTARADKLRIIKELQNKYPSYFGNLTNEQILAGNAAGAYRKLSQAIIESAMARAYEDKIVENTRKDLDLAGKQAKAIADLNNTKRYETSAYAAQGGVAGGKVETAEYEKQAKIVKQIAQERKDLAASSEQLAAKIKKPALLLGADEKETTEREKDIQSLADRIADAEVKAQQRIDELKLQAMQEGYNKQKAEAKKQYSQELDRIAQEERERLQALEKGRKAGLRVTPEQVKAVSVDTYNQRYLAQQVYTAAMAKLFDTEQRALTEKYSDYTGKRINIERQFNEDIQKLIILRNEAQKNGNDKAVADLTAAINRARVEMAKSLMQLSFEQFQQSPEYVRAFEDLKDTSNETLTYLMGEMEKYKVQAASSMDPQALREYTTTLRELSDEVRSRDPFEALIKSRKKLADAEREMAQAQAAIDLVRAGGKVVTGMRTDSSGKIVASYLTEEQAIKRLIAIKDKLQGINNEILEAEKDIIAMMTDLFNEVGNVGKALGGTAGDVLGLLGNIGTFTLGTIESIKAMSITGANALTTMEKASVILTILSAGIQIMQQLDSILPTAENEYLKYDAKIEEINRLRDAVSEYELAVLKATQAERSWFGSDSLRSLADYKEQQLKIQENYFRKLYEQQAIYQNQSGGGWITNPWNSLLEGYDKIYGTSIFGRDYEEGTTAAMANLRIETRKRSKGLFGSGIGGKSQKTEDLRTWIKNQPDLSQYGELFDSAGFINEELAKVILDKYGDKLVGQTKETLEELVELKEQYDEFIAQLREYVNELYEPLVGNMVDSLWDWLDSGKDALKSFKEYAGETFRDIVSDMMRTIVLKNVFGTFESDIADIYEKYSTGGDMAAMAAAVAARMQDLVDTYETQLPGLQTLLKSITESLSLSGIDITNATNAAQTAQSGGVRNITEETGSRIDGNLIAQTNRLISVDENITGLREQANRALDVLLQIASSVRRSADNSDEIKRTLAVIQRDGISLK
jgi:hypothetical protein